MNKVFLIIQREYLTRVRKKSFIIMTLVGPLLMGGVFLVMILLGKVSEENKKIAVINQSHLFENKLGNNEGVDFIYVNESVENAKKKLKTEEYTAVMQIPEDVKQNPQKISLYFEKQPSINLINQIESEIQKQIETDKLVEKGVDQKVLDAVKTNVHISTFKVTEAGDEKSNSGAVTAIGYLAGALIYFFIFLFGNQVMRGIIEEKTNRIVEVIISSVKPFQLMMGKIVGIALVGLTQFLLWIGLTFAVTTFVQNTFQKQDHHVNKTTSQLKSMKDQAAHQMENEEDAGFFEAFKNINLFQILLVFLFYFIGGYLLYAALFAAVGSAVDSEADTQQFMLPITIPLILSFLVIQFVIASPDGPIAFWFSVIPLTSPVVMMVRIPFGVPVSELIISMVSLVLGFLGTTWMAGKIYRTGILMYGKKPTYREIGKWLFYKA